MAAAGGRCLTHLARPAESPADGSALPETPAPPGSAGSEALSAAAARICATPTITRRRRHERAPAPDGRFRPPTLATTMLCVPSGTRLARDQVDALAAYRDHPARASLRSDRDARYGAIWEVLVHGADWRTLTWCGTWEALAERVQVSRSTVARALAWFRAAGLLAVVHTGACAAMLGGTVNRAPTYVLCVPETAGHSPTVGIDTPPGGERLGVINPDRAREASPAAGHDRGAASRLGNPGTNSGGPRWALSAVPRSRRERLAACEALLWRAPTLRAMSARLLRHLLRGWFDAGWSPSDVLWALDHTPTGAAWTYTTDPRTPAAWVRHRLGQWRQPDGTAYPSRSQQAARQVEQSDRPRPARVDLVEWRAELAARRERPEQLAERSRRGGALVRAALAAAHGRRGSAGA